MDLLEALLLAACFAVIVIPVPAPHFRGNNRITDSCLIRNDPRKENQKIYPLLYFDCNSIFLHVLFDFDYQLWRLNPLYCLIAVT